MNRLFAILLALTAFGQAAQAQWYTKTYNLAAGWNGIWLSGDASYTTVGELFGGTLASGSLAVSEVWRWNPNPDQTQFIQNPSTPTTTSDEWTVWKRDGTESKLTRMVGNSSYLIRASGPTSVSIKMKAITPSTTWLLSGANFLGFPALSGGGVMSTFFSSMISGGNKGLPTGTKVYKYVGGELSATNPVQVAVASERVDPDTAYWFNYATVSDFEGPVEYELPSGNGLSFGRTLPTQLLGITNRSTSAVTLSFALEASNEAPPGQPAVLGAVALVQRTFSPVTNSYTETPVGALGSFAVSVPASGRVTLEFGVNRAGFTEGGVYASILRVRDSLNLSDVRLPVTALAASPAGLWVCEVKVNAVSSTPAVSPVTVSTGSGATATAASQNLPQATRQAFPLYYLLHIDGAGVTRVLRQAFVGKLTSAGNALGITVKESLIQSAAVSDVKPARYFSPILPYATPVVTASGNAPGAVQWTLTHGYDDPANPFVHTYHPDHDNLDAKFANKLPAGVESYTVVRTCALSFTATPPDGSTVAGWGSMIFGGNYTESLSGLNKVPLQTGGTFRMRRLSEISEINTTTP
jgi:hypothetical protein